MKLPDSEAKIRWKKENIKLIGLSLHKKYDEDIIDLLEEKGKDKQKFIKEALREYMANHPEDR